MFGREILQKLKILKMGPMTVIKLAQLTLCCCCWDTLSLSAGCRILFYLLSSIKLRKNMQKDTVEARAEEWSGVESSKH